MLHKKYLSQITIAAVLILALVIAITLFRGTSLKDVMSGIFLTTIYGLIIAIYLSRIALVFLGIFAIYKILRDRVNKSDTSKFDTRLLMK
jgi:hypothetical protein